jgi:hypothetical protein
MAATRIDSGIGPSCCCTCSATLPDVTSTACTLPRAHVVDDLRGDRH